MQDFIMDHLYTIGLILVSLYMLTGVDDFIWDIITLFRRVRYRKQLLDLHKLDTVPPKLLAVIIAAWREDNVLGDVIDNIIESVHYPRSMYHIFLGVYPNDEPTLAVARALTEKYPNVHTIVNCAPGPTSKAQNINHVIRQIRQFEQERQWRFASLTIHDSEDVVHPYEFKVTNYLLDTHEALQFPVFPLMQMPRLRSFFKTITVGTYADEFAENHFTTMVSRYNSGAFVPSAGTGFVLSRKTLEVFGDEDVLPSESLTEDYKLSLTLFEKGIQLYYVLERVPRITDDDKLAWDFIATRSMFPGTFKTAVKQKTRWILGITMQSFKFSDIFKIKGLRFAGRYSLYKDLKAKVGNMLVFVGYPVLFYFLVSLFIPLEPIYPKYTLSWYLCVAVSVMMVERQLFRSIAIYNVYGMRSVFFACLLPPILPIRLMWGNIINMVATMRAYKQKIFGDQKKAAKRPKQSQETAAAPASGSGEVKEAKKIAWAKTDHSFLEKPVLRRYHRKLGDILLEKGYITQNQLQKALREMSDEELSLGGYLLKHEMLKEKDLLSALSNVKHIQYFDIMSLGDYNLPNLKPYFDSDLLRELLVVPLMKTESGFVVAFCDKSPMTAQTTLRNKYGIAVHAVFASQETIEKALEIMCEVADNIGGAGRASAISGMFSSGAIGYEQAIIARNFKYAMGSGEDEVLKSMGLLPREELAEIPGAVASVA